MQTKYKSSLFYFFVEINDNFTSIKMFYNKKKILIFIFSRSTRKDLVKLVGNIKNKKSKRTKEHINELIELFNILVLKMCI